MKQRTVKHERLAPILAAFRACRATPRPVRWPSWSMAAFGASTVVALELSHALVGSLL
jgi:hypothetical protein